MRDFFWYLPTYVTYAKILAHVRDQVRRFYSNCQSLKGVNVCYNFVEKKENLSGIFSHISEETGKPFNYFQEIIDCFELNQCYAITYNFKKNTLQIQQNLLMSSLSPRTSYPYFTNYFVKVRLFCTRCFVSN